MSTEHRKNPVRVHQGGLSGRYYAITRYKVIDAERDLIEAQTKHDVTTDVEGHIANATKDLRAELEQVKKKLQASNRTLKLLGHNPMSTHHES